MALTLAQFAMMGGDYPGSIAGNGYVKLPNGLIIQWGQSSTGGTGTSAPNTVTFPAAFPNASLNITLQVNGGSSQTYYPVTNAPGSGVKAQFTTYMPGGWSYQWFAIGY